MPTGKIIRLIREDGHYDGCNSFAGFLNKSYFCDDCNRDTITKTSSVIPAQANAAPSANAWTVPISLIPNDLLHLVSSLPQPLSTTHVSANFSETSATTTTCSVGGVASTPSVTPSRNAPTVVTCTNWTTKYVMAVTVMPGLTSADGGNVTSAKRMCTWQRTNATFNGYLKVMTILNGNVCRAMKWAHKQCSNLPPMILTLACGYNETLHSKSTATTKPSRMPREINHPFFSAPRPTRKTIQSPFTDTTAQLSSFTG